MRKYTTFVIFTATMVIGAYAWAQPGDGQRQRALGGRPDFDRMLQRFDANSDDQISEDEFGGRQRFFDRLDVDGDGVLVREEFVSVGERGQSSGAKPGSGTATRSRTSRYEAFPTQQPAPGDLAPTFELYDVEGNLVSLEELLRSKPVLIETGSYTCPVFRNRHASMEKLHDDFSDKIHLVVLYGKEAHPGSKRFPDVEQPVRNEQRIELAKGAVEELGIGMPVAVDDINNRVTTDLGGLPNCGYLIGQDGRVFHKLSWIHPDLMREPIQALLKLGGSGGEDPPRFAVGGNHPRESGKAREAEPKRDRQQRRSRGGPRFTSDVATHLDLVYARVGGRPLRLDIYLPKATKEHPPLVMWIHGGGWKSGSKSRVNGAILRLAEHGYAVASIDYRLGDLQAHPNHIHDCKGALRWIKAHAKEYGYDPDRVAVGGGSAGGHLALLLGMSADVDELEGDVGGNLEQSSRVQAIVDLYGPSELVALANSGSGFGRRHSFDSRILESASPLHYLSDDDPPVLILQGDRDRVVLPSQSELLHERYQQAGMDSKLHMIPGAGHGGGKFSDRRRFELILDFLNQRLRD